MKKIKCVVPVTAILLFGALASANAQIITYSNRATFNTAFGSTTVEDFTSNFHFPITTGVLNSATNLVVSSGTPIVPGDIKAGVTYSTPVQAGNFFNIDAGGGYVGGFLDSAVGGTPVLTATFNGPVKAFGFDTNDLMGAFKVTINYGGTPYVAQPFNGAGFYGFSSNNQDITSISLQSSTSGSFGFDLDNFTFSPIGGVTPKPTGTPEPGSMALATAGFVTAGGLISRRRKLAKKSK